MAQRWHRGPGEAFLGLLVPLGAATAGDQGRLAEQARAVHQIAERAYELANAAAPGILTRKAAGAARTALAATKSLTAARSAAREHGPGHLVVHCQAPGCRSAWYQPRHERRG